MVDHTRSHRAEDRIVSSSQPYVRLIAREKTKANIGFGTKVAVSMVDGYAQIDLAQSGRYSMKGNCFNSLSCRSGGGANREAVPNSGKLAVLSGTRIRLSGWVNSLEVMKREFQAYSIRIFFVSRFIIPLHIGQPGSAT